MKARVCIFDVNWINRDPVILDNKYELIEDNSTWSIDIFMNDQVKMLAVGSNSKNISLWDLNDIFIKKESKRITISGMGHNIPCL